MIRKLGILKFGQIVRDDGPVTHLPRPARRPWVGR